MEYTVTIANKTSTLKYPFSTRREIENRLKKGLFEACFSGLIEDQITILWAGLKHDTKGNKGLTPEILEAQIGSHHDQGGDVQAVMMTATRAVLNAKLIPVNAEQVNLLLDKIETGDEEGKE